MEKLGLKFHQMSTPRWFTENSAFAWGFWGHRLKLYREAIPHYGYEVMKKLGQSKLDKDGYFIFTSNVDGAFLKAGFDENRIVECHGSVRYLQCLKQCTEELWSTDGTVVEFSQETFLATEPLPKCKNCDRISRPNVLMFEDYSWNESRYITQYYAKEHWIEDLKPESRLVVIEVGAGNAVPTVRLHGERIAAENNGTLIRINLRDTEAPEGSIVLPLGGKDALTRIETELAKLQQ